ncbi:MAG: segregation/condensation protein A [Lachnospiraceae bacterium]|nr:segregation/condensation protein A [Lachnospiraceae bacterium]
MALEVKLQVFEGPLDLLLHLIDKNKIDIYDIPIVTITEQYLEYIRQMEHEDMEVTSEFLVMAATLLDIKCRMLLPKTVNEEGEEEDPRAELVEQLLQYKMYKYMSYELKDMQIGADCHFFRKKDLPDEVRDFEIIPDPAELVAGRDIALLNSILQELLKRQKDRVDPIRAHFGQIEREEIDMDEKTLFVKAYVREHGRVSFRQLLEKQHSKSEIIVTFLVILEEIKTGGIEVQQDDTFGDIMITFKEKEETGVIA